MENLSLSGLIDSNLNGPILALYNANMMKMYREAQNDRLKKAAGIRIYRDVVNGDWFSFTLNINNSTLLITLP